MSPAWQDSLDRLDREDPTASDLLRLLAFLAPEPVPLDLLDAGREGLPEALAGLVDAAAKREQAFASLKGAGLLLVADDDITLPREIGLAIVAELDAEGRREWCGAALQLVRAGFPADSGEIDSWDRCAQLLPHLLAAVDRAKEAGLRSADVSWLLDRGATYLDARGDLPGAFELSERALENPPLGEDDSLLGTLHHDFGCLLDAMGRLPAAREEHERAVAIHRATLGPEHSDTVADRVSLASVMEQMGEREAALAEVDDAIAASRRGGKPERVDARAARTRGWILLKLGRADEAKEAYEESLELTRELCGAGHPEMSSAHMGLGLMLDETGDLKNARVQFERALEIAEDAYGPTHPEVAIVRSNLGPVLQSLGAFQPARRQLELALEAGRASLPDDHRALWIRHRKLASVLQGLRQLEAARTHAEQALALSERTVGPNDPRTAGDLSTLGAILSLQGKHEAARNAYRRALAIAEVEHGPSHLEVATYAMLVGRASQQLGNLDGAREQYERALGVYGSEAEAEPSQAAAARVALTKVLADLGRQLAATARSLGQEEEGDRLREAIRATFVASLERELAADDVHSLVTLAEACFEEEPRLARSALERAEEKLDDEAKDSIRQRIGAAWHRFGRARSKESETGEAVEAFERALPLLGAMPFYRGAIVHDMADVRRAEERYSAAVDLYREALALKREAGEDADQRNIATTLLMLGRAQEDGGDAEAALVTYGERLGLLSSLPERDHEGEGITLHDMGNALRALDRKEEAAERYREAAERKRAAGESGRPEELAVTLLALARAQIACGDLDDALATLNERMEVLTSMPRRNRQSEGVTLHDIADVRRAQGRLEEATDLYRRAAERKREGGENPRDLAVTLHWLGRVLEQLGKLEDALAVYRERLETLTSLPERDVQAEGVTLHDIADVRRAQGALEEAISLYGEAAERKREAGENPRDLAITLLALAETRLDADDAAGGRSAAEEAVERLREAPDPQPARLAEALTVIAQAALNQEQPGEALGPLTEAEELAAANESLDPLDLASVRTLLAFTHGRLGDDERARAVREQAREVLAALVAGEERLDPGDRLHAASVLCIECEAFDLAAELVERMRRAAAEDGSLRRDLAELLHSLGRAYELGVEDLERALAIYEEGLGVLESLPERDRQAEGVALHDIGDVRRAQDRLEEAADLYERAVKRKREVGDGGNADSIAFTEKKLEGVREALAKAGPA